MISEGQFIAALIFVFGAIVGSFLNVCIVRLPHEQSVVLPPSHCVRCKKSIPWYDNVPLLSYLWLGGRCRFCKAGISPRYFIVELLTALMFVGFYSYYGLTPSFFAYLLMACGFVVATFVDLEHRIIPDEVSLGGAKAGLILSLVLVDLHDTSNLTLFVGRMILWGTLVFCAFGHVLEFFFARELMQNNSPEENAAKEEKALWWTIGLAVAFDLAVWLLLPKVHFPGIEKARPYLLSLDASVIGMMVGGGIIYAMGVFGNVIFKKESMGGGDVKLLAMIGAFLGWKLAVLTFFIAPFFGAVYGIIEKIRTKKSEIAYGPFLVAGALISLFYGSRVIEWIMSGYGLYP